MPPIQFATLAVSEADKLLAALTVDEQPEPEAPNDGLLWGLQ